MQLSRLPWLQAVSPHRSPLRLRSFATPLARPFDTVAGESQHLQRWKDPAVDRRLYQTQDERMGEESADSPKEEFDREEEQAKQAVESCKLQAKLKSESRIKKRERFWYWHAHGWADEGHGDGDCGPEPCCAKVR
ncbi:unnamed protein product [Symbiodinium sp. CCMP2592]|nr:unnamed protein product [Symbiodinium sp. CCMP2592]